MGAKLARAASLAASYAALLLRAPGRAAAPAEIEPQRLLVLGYAAIGDLLFFLPVLRALRARFPRASITFVADRYSGTEEIIPAAGLADEIWLYEHSELAQWRFRREIFRRVRAGGFDAVVVSHGTPMRAFAQAILKIPLRVGQCRRLAAPHAGWSWSRYALWRLRRGTISGEFERRLCLNRVLWLEVGREHAMRRNLRLAEALGCGPGDASPPPLPERDSDRAFAEKALAALAGRKIVALHLGSPGTPRDPYMKIWPIENWAAVCRDLAESYPCAFVAVGGPGEEASLQRLRASFAGPVLDLIGRASFLQTCAVLRRCALVLGGDTGPLKAAMALGVPTLSVWGPSSRHDNGAFWDPPRHIELQLELPCSPCVQLALPSEGSGVLNFNNCGHHDCLGKLGPALALAALRARFGSVLLS